MLLLAEIWLPLLALAAQLPFFALRLLARPGLPGRLSFAAALAGAALGLALGLRDRDVTLLAGQLAALCVMLRLRRAEKTRE